MTIALGVGLVVAVIGLVGSAFLAPSSQAKHAREAWHRDHRLSVYRDVTRHLQRYSVVLDDMVSDQHDEMFRYRVGNAAETDDPIRPADDVTALIDLVAPDHVIAAWQAFTGAAELLGWATVSNGAGGKPPEALPVDFPAITRTRKAIAHLRTAMRDDLRR